METKFDIAHTRPFDLDAAKAGAPFCTSAGEAVEMLKWDRKHLLCIIGEIQNDRLDICGWTAAGDNKSMAPDRNLVMLPLGLVQGKPFFVGDTIIGTTGHPFVAEPRDMDGTLDTWRWPVPADPALVTGMALSDFDAVLLRTGYKPGLALHVAEAIANAALRHAVDAGQLFRPQESSIVVGPHWLYGTAAATAEAAARLSVRPNVERDAERDLAIALEVREACQRAAKNAPNGYEHSVIYSVNLATIIAGVKP